MSIASFLQIDLQNLFFEAKKKGFKIDFEKIFNYFNSRESEFLTEAYIYMIRGGEEFDSTKFETKLSNIGYKVKTRTIIKVMNDNKVFYRNTTHDVLIAIDCVDKINYFDKLILMSGDGDFIELCKYLRSKNKQIEIWSFKESYNASLGNYANSINFINEEFFYKKPDIQVFGFKRNINYD